MQLNLSGHHVAISPALRKYVATKLKRPERHFDHVTNAHVVLSTEKLVRKAEATVHISGGQLFADSRKDDMYAAIDGLVDKLDQQIRRHKDKVTNHHRSEGSIKCMN